MDFNFKKPLFQAKAFLKQAIWKATLMMMIWDVFSHDDHLSSLHDSIAFGSQEFDIYEDPHVYSHKNPRFDLVRTLYNWWIVNLEFITYSSFFSHETRVFWNVFHLFKMNVATMFMIYHVAHNNNINGKRCG